MSQQVQKMQSNLMAKVNNAFGLALFKVVAAEAQGKNIFLSPYSISVALAMTKLGAQGETDEAMAQAMQWGKENPDLIHNQFHLYTKLIQQPSPKYQLSTANRIYLEKTFSVLDEFKQKTKELYMAEAVSANFMSNSDGERKNINGWVEQQTQNKIKELLPVGVLNVDTKMVLVNAIYFKGKWDKQFEERQTRPMPFKIAPGQTKDVQMMTTTEIFPYWQDSDLKCSAVELPYQGKELSMVIILPDEDFGLDALVKNLTSEKLSGLLENLRSSPANLQVFLPRFEVTSTSLLKPPLSVLGMSPAFGKSANFSGMTDSNDIQISDVIHKTFIKMTKKFSLKQTLSALGMADAFGTSAKFSGITSDPTGLLISEVIHKAFVQVNEEGTEAAAATAVVMAPGCARPRPIPITSAYKLKEQLSTMGMTEAFSGSADFGKVCKNAKGLHLSEVVHQAFVQVNEEGTEAAAASGAVGVQECEFELDTEEIFQVDHPFLHVLVSRQASDIALFLGRIVEIDDKWGSK